MASIVSERYALSLYEVAKEAGKAPELLDELLAVAQVFGENPDLMKVMQAPAIQLPEKKELLQTVFGGRIDGFLLNFLMLITEKRRIGLLYEMAESYKQQYYFEEGICEVTAVTASPMDADLIEKLKEKMCSVTGKKVVLQTRVDPSILGGIVVKVDNKQIDTSVKTRLEELAQKLTQTIA
ncbi:MAG: ATP synthase F1 subunit delta [Clostridiaceae bacterium]|nr:ATP synthase F1 subunit delta [Clostridiaceae bacterium]